MIQKVQALLIDDLDGSEADETVKFALDGKACEIDLSKENADKLRQLLAPYIEKARRAGGWPKPGHAPARTTGVDSAEIRAWATDNGYTPHTRGRVPIEIRMAYEKANS
ncbi:histone-like nucleoid-structuring protein Lsr2 [Streptomyces sp. NBC_01497]|uniref:histone-like nucleoid-structuring protein Lsr2 n=1 Tax=Streptomyces sp. NBC_01497 TaxID=2903885 RepID=UPI002E34D737|nr:Lsr2 family protein [Streptomyces sp. NBC_01497]